MVGALTKKTGQAHAVKKSGPQPDVVLRGLLDDPLKLDLLKLGTASPPRWARRFSKDLNTAIQYVLCTLSAQTEEKNCPLGKGPFALPC